MKSDDEIANLFAPIVANNGVEETLDRVKQVVHMMKDRVNFVYELWPLCSFFFIAPTEYDAKTTKKRWKEYSAQQMTELADVLEGIEDFSIEGQEPVVMKWVEDKGYKLGDVMNAFRLTLVGEGKGPRYVRYLCLPWQGGNFAPSSQGNRSFGLIHNNFSLNGFLQHVAEGYSESSRIYR